MNKWRKNEIDALLKAYQEFGGNWNRISREVGDRHTVRDCQKRLPKIQSNNVNNNESLTGTIIGGSSSAKIDKQILRLVKKYGLEWKLIEK